MHSNIFVEISLLLALCTVIAMVVRSLRQPLIIGYIITGLIVGPSVLGLVQSPDTIEVLGTFGVALLLFVVGLGLNPKVVKEVGKVSLLTGLGQVLFTTTVGFLIARALGFDAITGLYIGVALAFSSTIIILKLLNDKKEQNKLYGKVAIGFLLVQDIIATIALLVASAAGTGGLSMEDVGLLAIKGTALIGGVILFANLVIKRLTGFLSRSQELLFLFAIAWGFAVATLFIELGFSLEVGALLAGVALASMPYAQEASSRLRPLRDFFIVVFFIALGSTLNLSDIQSVIWHAIGLSALVLVGNPLIVMTIMGLLGYTKKTSFKAGLTVAQISEFSLIFVLIGFRNGQISEQVVSMITVVAIITIAISSYMMIYSNGLYRVLEKHLKLFEKRKVKSEREKKQSYDAILFGYKRGGSEFVKVFEKLTKHYVVVDYDPDAIEELERKQVPYLYGDGSDIELLDELSIERAKIIVAVITDHQTNVFLLRETEKRNPNAVVVCHADSVQEAVELYGLGASFVVMPHFIGNEKVSGFIRRNGFKKSEFKHYREKHISYLQSHFETDPS